MCLSRFGSRANGKPENSLHVSMIVVAALADGDGHFLPWQKSIKIPPKHNNKYIAFLPPTKIGNEYIFIGCKKSHVVI